MSFNQAKERRRLVTLSEVIPLASLGSKELEKEGFDDEMKIW